MSQTITETKKWTKEEISENMENNNVWLIRGLLAIYKRQTKDEQKSETVKYNNNVGFTIYDAPFLSSLAEQYNRKGFLSEKQIYVLRQKMKKYARQLAKIANGKI